MKITGTLKSHRSVNESWGVGTLLVEVTDAQGSGNVPGPGEVITVVSGQLGNASPGEKLCLEGEFEQTKYGMQFKATRQTSLGIQSDGEAHRWLTRLDGVGPVLARAIYDHYEGLGGVLKAMSEPPAEHEPDPLAEIDGIGETTARTIRESWGQVGLFASPEDLEYLDGLKLTHFEANNVLGYCKRGGVSPQQLLETQPYTIVKMKGFGFKRADRVAIRAGVDRNSPTRADAAVRYQVAECCQADTMVSVRQLIKETCDLIGVGSEIVHKAIERVSGQGDVVLRKDEGGRRWAHPTRLFEAERRVFSLLMKETDRERERGQGLVAAKVGDVDLVERAQDAFELTAELRRLNAKAEARDLGKLAQAAVDRADSERLPQPCAKPDALGDLLGMIDDDSVEEDWPETPYGRSA